MLYSSLSVLYRVGPKKVSLIIFAISLSTAGQFSKFLAHIYYGKFATRGYIVSPPNMVCVATLPCEILTMTFSTLNVIHHCKKSPVFTSVVIIANFCRMILKWIVPDEYYLFSSDRYALAMAAHGVTNVNFGFKQFATAVGIYAATNPLWPLTTFQ